MINLEVWLPPDMDTIPILATNYVKYCGSVRSPGRLGWFIPVRLTAPIKNHDPTWDIDTPDVNWNLFQNENFVEAFDIDATLKDVIYNNSLDYNDE